MLSFPSSGPIRTSKRYLLHVSQKMFPTASAIVTFADSRCDVAFLLSTIVHNKGIWVGHQLPTFILVAVVLTTFFVLHTARAPRGNT